MIYLILDQWLSDTAKCSQIIRVRALKWKEDKILLGPTHLMFLFKVQTIGNNLFKIEISRIKKVLHLKEKVYDKALQVIYNVIKIILCDAKLRLMRLLTLRKVNKLITKTWWKIVLMKCPIWLRKLNFLHQDINKNKLVYKKIKFFFKIQINQPIVFCKKREHKLQDLME